MSKSFTMMISYGVDNNAYGPEIKLTASDSKLFCVGLEPEMVGKVVASYLSKHIAETTENDDG